MGNPSSNIAFGLIAGFIVFVTARGELPAYLCVVGLGSGCPQPGATSSPSKSVPGNAAGAASSNGGAASSNPTSSSGGVNGTAIITNPGWPSTNDDPFGTLPTLIYNAPAIPAPVQTSTDSTITYGDPGGDESSSLPTGGYDPYSPYQSYDPYTDA